MVDISKSSMIKNIWQTFRDRVNSEVVDTFETISDGTTVTLKHISASYPDKVFLTKSNYPICIVNTPSLSTEKFTLSKSTTDATIDIEIYTNQAEAADGFLDKIIDAVETGKGEFAQFGLHNVQLDSTDSDMVERGSIKIHMRRARFNFLFRYTDTKAF